MSRGRIVIRSFRCSRIKVNASLSLPLSHFITYQRVNNTLILDYEYLLRSLVSKKLRKLVIFQNHNRHHPRDFDTPDSAQTQTPVVSETAAETSLKLENFSASFISSWMLAPFFFSRKPSWKWNKLKSLTLTSRLLTPESPETDADDVLKAAAAAAKNMPQLETMEIWNGEAQLAALFKYQPSGGQVYAAITCRSRWDFALRPPVIQAWEAVAHKYGGRGLTVTKELLDSADIKSHGYAIHYLKLSTSVVRPVLLQQIRTDYNIHEIWEKRQNELENISRRDALDFNHANSSRTHRSTTNNSILTE